MAKNYQVHNFLSILIVIMKKNLNNINKFSNNILKNHKLRNTLQKYSLIKTA